MSGVLFYVQHLLGVGHVKRAASIVRAMTRVKVPVTVVLGGERVSHADFGEAEVRYLPSVRARDETFKVLLDSDGEPIDDAWRAARTERLMNVAHEVNPDLLLIELFPFGRRQFRFELIPLLDAFKGRARIVCSARDVIVNKSRQERNDETVETLRTYFDDILVHGVAEVIPLGATFPDADRISDMIEYTGYVREETRPMEQGASGAGEIVISVGSGAIGEDLLRAVVAARPLSAKRDLRWRMIAGDSLPADVYRDLERQCGGGLTLETARRDFIYLLRNCALSISLGGYNTVMDVMGAACRNLVVPFRGGAETEQLFRARAFAKAGWIQIFDGDLTVPEVFAKAIDRAFDHPVTAAPGLDIDGANRTARIIAEMLNHDNLG